MSTLLRKILNLELLTFISTSPEKSLSNFYRNLFIRSLSNQILSVSIQPQSGRNMAKTWWLDAMIPRWEPPAHFFYYLFFAKIKVLLIFVLNAVAIWFYKCTFCAENCTVPQMIPNRKWSRDRKWSPKWTANDPRPQMIPKVDRKWSRKKNRNDLDSS